MATSTIGRFPQELIDNVIDHVVKLKGFKRTELRTCSLISKAWLPRSRYHLFYSVSLHTNTIHPPRFLKLLDSPCRHIASYVRHLELKEGRGGKFWLKEALPKLSALDSIESLSIFFFRFDMDDATAITFFSSFKLLKYLLLGRCHCSSPAQFLDAISASGRLERLVLGIDVVQNSSNGASTILPAMSAGLDNLARVEEPKRLALASSRGIPSHLRILEMGSCNMLVEVLTWLQCGDDVSPVDTLRLNIANKDEVPIWSEFMRTIGSSLNDLSVTFTECLAATATADAFGRDLDLGRNDHLRIIRVPCVYLGGGLAWWRRGASWLPLILARISSPRIEEVLMTIQITLEEDLDNIDWVAMDHIFKRPNFSQLKRILIYIRVWSLPLNTQVVTIPAQWVPNGETSASDVPTLREQMLCWLDDRLPACHTRGILDVEVI